jgi:tetratricopeptide (TPR) repeat protein
MVVGCASLVLALSLVTRDRNVLWSTPEAFLKHDVTHSGESPRALHNLASWYQNDGQYDKALVVMRSLIAANNGSLSLTHTTTYLAVLLNVGLFDEVLDLSENLLAVAGNNYERAIVLRYMGTAFTGIADDEAAVDSFDEARRTLPLDYESGLSYGYSLIQIGEIEAAFTHIAEMKQRFGDRAKLRMLAKVADNALQASRANAVEAAPPE